MIPRETEAAILRSLKGDRREREAGLQQLFDALREPLFALCLRMTGRHELADDAVQEACLDVFTGIRSFRGEARLTTWVYRVALRAATRVAVRAERSGIARLAEDPIGNDQDPSAAAIHQDGAARLLLAIMQLPAPQRAVVALNALQDVALTEVATILGVPEGTVHSRLHAARARLKQALMK